MEPLLNQLAENGLLGLLLALSIGANIVQYKVTQNIQEKRVADLKESRDAFLAPLNAIKQTVDLILALVQPKGRRG